MLNECIERLAPNWEAVFSEYECLRKPHADALADLAIGNFVEMRDKTGSRLFRAYKRFDRTMHRVLPGWYAPLYTMISFTRIPYAFAVARARQQNYRMGFLAIMGLLWLIVAIVGYLKQERGLLFIAALFLLFLPMNPFFFPWWKEGCWPESQRTNFRLIRRQVRHQASTPSSASQNSAVEL